MMAFHSNEFTQNDQTPQESHQPLPAVKVLFGVRDSQVLSLAMGAHPRFSSVVSLTEILLMLPC